MIKDKMEKNELSLREIQMAEYSILCKVVRFFEKNDIHYILCGGSMLGAVRHNGFIPWDDDIDTYVPRDDYEKLKRIWVQEEPDIEGVVLRLPGDADSPHPFIKAIDKRYIAMEETRGDDYRAYLWVDIFPMDHFPDDRFRHKLYLARIISLIRVLSSNTITKEYMAKRGYYSNPLKMIEFVGSKCLFHMLGGASRISKRIDRIGYNLDRRYKSSYHVGDGAWPSGMNDYFPIDAVKPVMKHKFEDGEFNIPVNYDKYLTLFYGDYMTLPPESERIDHHITVYKLGE